MTGPERRVPAAATKSLEVSAGLTVTGIESVGPFGTPDGARADFDTVVNDFVDFEGNAAYGALSTRPDDAAVRVIVGRLGAGKTVYMRRLSDYQAHVPSVYADHPQQNLPATEVIVRASDWFERMLTERWTQLWGRAILRALATHLLRPRNSCHRFLLNGVRRYVATTVTCSVISGGPGLSTANSPTS